MTGPLLGGFRPERELAADKCPIAPFSEIAAGVSAAASTSDAAVYIVKRALDNPPSDQRALPGCVGNGYADTLEILMPTRVDISRSFINWNTRRLNGDEAKVEGGYIRLAAQSTVDHGVCRESLWPYLEETFTERPDLAAYEEAYDHRLGYSPIIGAPIASYRITSTGTARGDEVEAAVRADHPVIFGADVGQPLVDYFSALHTDDLAFGTPHRPIGKHCMVVVGVRRTSTERLWLVRNSWGPYGLADHPGHFWARDSYLTIADDLTVPVIGPTFG